MSSPSSIQRRTNKLFYGFMALAPMIAAVLSMFLFIGAIFNFVDDTGDHQLSGNRLPIIAFFVLVVVAGLFIFVAMVIFIRHALRNPLVPEAQRMFWVVGFVMGTGITTVIYYFVYISREDQLIAIAQAENSAQNLPT